MTITLQQKWFLAPRFKYREPGRSESVRGFALQFFFGTSFEEVNHSTRFASTYFIHLYPISIVSIIERKHPYSIRIYAFLWHLFFRQVLAWIPDFFCSHNTWRLEMQRSIKVTLAFCLSCWAMPWWPFSWVWGLQPIGFPSREGVRKRREARWSMIIPQEEDKMMHDGWWMVDHGWWMMDDGRWTMDDGWWIMDNGWWMMDDGRWTMDDGLWIMDDGWWTMDDGRWMMDYG